MTDLTPDAIRKLLDGVTSGPWLFETVRTSCGVCHKIGPWPHKWRHGADMSACIYDDYPSPPEGTDTMLANARLIAAAPDLARLALAQADALASFQRNSRDTFDAMCAMRDAINEHIPMPSLESDLLQGPENSVFCATVSEAVVNALQAQAAEIARLRDRETLLAVQLENLLEVYAEEDRQLCCDGRECGCYGATAYQEAEHYARAALKGATE